MIKKQKKRTQKDCDKLLSPLVKSISPECMLCGKPTQVAHHFFHKSKCLALRYRVENLINLCNGCHYMLHFDEGYWAGKIIEIRGMKWFKKLDKVKQSNKKFKPDYDKIYKTLKLK